VQSLEQLSKFLRVSEVFLVLADEEVRALDVQPSAPEGYVWPNLHSWSFSENARVVLIEAAGAVGKTAAAASLAERLHWPLINAAQAQVGSYSLTGLLHDAFGLDSPFLGDLVGGRSGVVIDALDEAHLRAGTTNFQAFLENVNKVADRRHADLPNVVLFSRPDTADLIRASFEELGSPISSATIDFLDYHQACGFILSYMQRKSRSGASSHYRVAEQHAEKFAELRDVRMAEIATVLLGRKVDSAETVWFEVRGFLGYAPVLSVICEYLAVGNPHAKIKVNDSKSGSTRSVLLQIISNLLEREQEKFMGQVGSKLDAKLSVAEEWLQRDQAYSPSEQAIRLVSRTLDVPIVVAPPATLPASIRQVYESHAGQFIADHPFLAGREPVNVVFSDFIEAKAAVDTECAKYLKIDSDSRRNIGPFFYEFVHEFAPKDSDESQPVIDEALVQKVVASHAQSVDARSDGQVVYVQNHDQAQLMIPRFSDDSHEGMTYEVSGLSGLLELEDQLSRMLIVTDAAVGIYSEDKFLIGPRTTLICNEIIVDAPIISVASTRGNGRDVTLLIFKGMQVRANLSVDCRDPKALRIIGGDIFPTLLPYRVQSLTSHELAYSAGYVDLLGIIRVFRRSIQHGPSVFAEKLDKRVIGTNATKIKMIASLMSLGVVSLDGVHYRLDVAKLGSHGISMKDILGGHPSKDVVKFIALLLE